MQIVALLYRWTIDFPEAHIFDRDCITAKSFIFTNYHRQKLISIILGEIYGFLHDVCNWKVQENKRKFACFAHNLFGFDFYFLAKGV